MAQLETTLTLPSLVIAMPQLDDPNFKKCVVLILEHDENSSFGLIVNRPTKIPLKEVVQAQDIEIPNDLTFWYGGPVATSYGLILRVGKETKNSKPIIDVTSEESALRELIENSVQKNPDSRWLHPERFVVGYSGWGPKQLEEELRAGAWMEMALDLDWLYKTPPEHMWEIAFNTIGVAPGKMAPTIQPYLN